MAGTVSKKSTEEDIQKLILRSIFYNQSFPSFLMGFDSNRIVAEIGFLELRRFIVRSEGGFKLTEAGRRQLFLMYDGRMPPLIDLPAGAFSSREKQSVFIVGRRLAESIFREVSIGE